MSFRLNDVGNTRTTQQAVKTIKERTKLEEAFRPIFAEELSIILKRIIKIEPNGIDNSGEPILTEKKGMGDEDWLIVDGEKQKPLEVMVFPNSSPNKSRNYRTATIPEHKINRLIKKKSSLLIIRDDFYYLFNNTDLLWIQKEIAKWPFKPFGNKWCHIMNVNPKTNLITDTPFHPKKWREEVKLKVKKVLGENYYV